MQYSERLMVGVAGPTCAGKTKLEHGLEEALGDEVSSLPFDGMSRDLEYPEEAGLDDWEHPDCYRWGDYRRHLKDMKEGRITMVRLNSWERRETGLFERPVPPRPIVVSVGSLALYDEIAREQFDLTFYMEVPEHEYIKRRARVERILRPGIDPMPYIMDRIVPATRKFVEPQREHADAVIDGLQSPAHVLETVLKIMHARQNSSLDRLGS